MEICQVNREVPATRSEWRLYHLTDLHREDRNHAEKELNAFIQRIKDDDHGLWLGGGDYASLVLPGDPRFGNEDYLDEVPPARVADWAKETIVEQFHPIRDKCIGWGVGNHERTLSAKWHRNIAAEAAYDLGIQHLYLGQRGMSHVGFSLSTKRMVLKVYWHHGWSAGRSKSRKALHAERDLGATEADVYMVGHDHQPDINTWYQRQTYWSSRKRKWLWREVPKAFMNGGSWVYGQPPPDKQKLARKPSEVPVPTWEDGKNFRPEPPRSPVLHVHVDMGRGKEKRKSTGGEYAGRPAGFDFTEEMHSPRFYYDDDA